MKRLIPTMVLAMLLLAVILTGRSIKASVTPSTLLDATTQLELIETIEKQNQAKLDPIPNKQEPEAQVSAPAIPPSVPESAEQPELQCQYPDRLSNPPGGCDNSDPACGDIAKGAIKCESDN